MSTRSFELKEIDHWDEMCCICKNYDADPEVGRMYGICEISKRSPRETVKEAFQICDEVKC